MLLRFSFRNRKPGKEKTEEEIIAELRIALVGTGQYASMSMSDNWQEGEEKMHKDLQIYEDYAERYTSSILFSLTGKGWELFSIWFRRKNQDKTTPLRKAINLLEKALLVDEYNDEAKTILGGILVERVQVRDLERGLHLLNDLENKDSQIKGLIAKAERWLGKTKVESEYDYIALPLIPLTLLREERAKCRALIRTLKKEGRNEELIQILDHMYRLAILHDAATYVMLNTEHSYNDRETKKWDTKLKNLAENILGYSYKKNGRLKESNNSYLSENDYKTYCNVFPESKGILDPIALMV